MEIDAIMSGYWETAGPGAGTATCDTRRSYDAVTSEYLARISGELADTCAAARRSNGIAAVAADMTMLPAAAGSATAIVCFYSVIHLDRGQRRAAYTEMARVLRPGGYALVAFHTADNEVDPGGAKRLDEWWGEPVELTFRFLDPVMEGGLLEEAELHFVARLDRAPVPGAERPSARSYLLARKDDQLR